MRKPASWLRFGAFILGLSLLSGGIWLTRSAETPPWRNSGSLATGPLESPPKSTQRRNPETPFQSFGFVTYNVKNWLISSQNPEKTKLSKRAVIGILSSSGADVIGLSEIGDRNDVLEIQKMLKASRQDLPYFHYTGGIDPIRHLALLSRFPIISTAKPEIEIPGTGFSMQRGILDATLQIGESQVRFIGLHLKSKRIVPSLDESQLRVNEDMHVRNHLDRILKQTPDQSLVVYGDFNDHLKSLSTRTILGTYRSPAYLFPISAKDGRNENWTHFYDFQDSYSRIDFVVVSKSMKSRISPGQAKILDPPDWYSASDHRAVFVRFE
jgi:endonuclease/exonuclease/phosphatase family metal-dependent hydrolase